VAQVEDAIAMNHALMENLYVSTVCILNRIPIFVVGKPGSSKTLTMQVVGILPSSFECVCYLFV